MRDLAGGTVVRQTVNALLEPSAIVVRGILFDKTVGANWKVPWHQDLTIAVASRSDVAEYGPWSCKAGVLHVQPPASVLERMVTVRLHLDDCSRDNGALKVIVGSHRVGKVPERQIEGIVEAGSTVACEVREGGALLMRPLLVHSSTAAMQPGHRRVLHFDFAAGELAGGLRWSANSYMNLQI